MYKSIIIDIKYYIANVSSNVHISWFKLMYKDVIYCMIHIIKSLII